MQAVTPLAPSYYAASRTPTPLRPTLQGTVQADVCIVGAGYTGLSSGIALAEAGYKVVVLEQAQVGWGPRGATAARSCTAIRATSTSSNRATARRPPSHWGA